MAKDIKDLASKIAAKQGYTATVTNASELSVSKNGQQVVGRVIHNRDNDTVTVGDGSGVKTGDSTAWLNELK